MKNTIINYIKTFVIKLLKMSKLIVDIIFGWFSLTKLMELSLIASSICVLFSLLVAVDFFSQSANFMVTLEGPVHGVVKYRFITYFKKRNMSLPKLIDMNTMLSNDPSYNAIAFMKQIPIPDKPKAFSLETLPKEGNAVTDFLIWAVPIADFKSELEPRGIFVLSDRFEKLLVGLTYNQNQIIHDALVKSTVSAVTLWITNIGNADSIDSELKINKPHAQGRLLFGNYESGHGELLRIEGFGQIVNMHGNSNYSFQLGKIAKGTTDHAIVYTVGEPIDRRSVSIST